MSKTSLELFSGSKQVSNTLAKFGFNTITVDINPLLKPSICCDILNFDINQVSCPIDFFWASPDCRKLSRDSSQDSWHKETIKYRQYRYTPTDLDAAKSYALVAKTVELIKYFRPPVWFIENPVGRIQHLEPIKSLGHFRYGVNYKDFGFDYSKETYLFTNQYLPLSQLKVIRPGRGVIDVNGKYNRSIVPTALVEYLIKFIY